MASRPPEDLSYNREQEDADTQAQTVADDALGRHVGDFSEYSERGGTADPAAIIPDDTPDLVEVMNAMVTSGHIDNGAYEGEPMHDDEEDIHGITDDERDEV